MRRRRPTEATGGGGRKRFAYADQVHTDTVTPTRYFSRLVARLRAFDGWAISLAPAMLRTVIPLCPRQARVACWTSHPQRAPKKGIEGAWEAVIVVPARTLRPGVLDALVVKAPTVGGKPLAFPAWLCALLGMVDGDTLAELTPETGADVGRGWVELTRPIPKRRRRRRPPVSHKAHDADQGAGEGGQKHTPLDASEPRADPDLGGAPSTADEIN